MNTINTYRSYSTMKKFLEKGDKVFDKPIFDTAIRKYVNYLKSLEIVNVNIKSDKNVKVKS